jgi:CO dehydrogenase/acetyl-CoA synthase beta subunit
LYDPTVSVLWHTASTSVIIVVTINQLNQFNNHKREPTINTSYCDEEEDEEDEDEEGGASVKEYVLCFYF